MLFIISICYDDVEINLLKIMCDFFSNEYLIVN